MAALRAQGGRRHRFGGCANPRLQPAPVRPPPDYHPNDRISNVGSIYFRISVDIVVNGPQPCECAAYSPLEPIRNRSLARPPPPVSERWTEDSIFQPANRGRASAPAFRRGACRTFRRNYSSMSIQMAPFRHKRPMASGSAAARWFRRTKVALGIAAQWLPRWLAWSINTRSANAPYGPIPSICV